VSTKYYNTTIDVNIPRDLIYDVIIVRKSCLCDIGHIIQIIYALPIIS